MATVTQVPLRRIDHYFYPATDEQSRLVACRCTCRAEWEASDDGEPFAVWAMTHDKPATVPVNVYHLDPVCPGSNELVTVGLTDGDRLECRTCQRFQHTTPVPRSPVLRTVDAHPRRTEASW